MHAGHHRPDRSPGADPAVTALLRERYAPPADETYWQGLQERVLARLGETPVVAWWNVLSEWRMVGAVAATIALLLTGATLVREMSFDRTDREIAARAIIDVGVPLDETPTLVRGSRHLPPDAPERYLEPFEY